MMAQGEKEQLVEMVRRIVHELDGIAAEQRRQIDLNRAHRDALIAINTGRRCNQPAGGEEEDEDRDRMQAEQRLLGITSEAEFDALGEKGVRWLVPTAAAWIAASSDCAGDAEMMARGAVFLFEAACKCPSAIDPSVAATVLQALSETPPAGGSAPAAAKVVARSTHGALSEEDAASLLDRLCRRAANFV